ncbi:MAG: DUF721 domain-containing protein [Desulfonatronovibrio sp.]
MYSVDKSINKYLGRIDSDGSRYIFINICNRWDQIVGTEIAALVKPLGQKNKTLILGAQDSIIIQEITFASQQIIDMINDFCGSDIFDKLRVELLKGRTPLDRKLVHKPHIALPVKKPRQLGNLMGFMSEDSPVARCYSRYVDFFHEKK